VKDDISSDISPDVPSEPPIKSISVYTSNLTPEQTLRFYQVLGKCKGIFCTSTKEIQTTDLIEHHIELIGR
jgi:hypothetical protein